MEVLEWARKELSINELDDWYGVTRANLESLGISGLAAKVWFM